MTGSSVGCSSAKYILSGQSALRAAKATMAEGRLMGWRVWTQRPTELLPRNSGSVGRGISGKVGRVDAFFAAPPPLAPTSAGRSSS